MRRYFIFCLIFVCWLSSGNKVIAEVPSSEDSIAISGRVVGFKPDSDDHLVSFKRMDFSGRELTYSFAIAQNGSFSGKLPLSFESDVILSYESVYVNVYVKHGLPLNLEIFSVEAKVDANYNKAVRCLGALAYLNNAIFDFITKYEHHDFNTGKYSSDPNLSDSTYAAKRRESMIDELNFLDKYCNESQMVDSNFRHWASCYISYKAGWDIAVHPFMGKTNTLITSPGLDSLLDGISINNPYGLHSADYCRFLNIYVNTNIVILNNHGYSDLKDSAKRLELNSIFENYIANRFDGPRRDLALVYFYVLISNKQFQTDPAIINRLSNGIKDMRVNQNFYDQVGKLQNEVDSFYLIDKLKGLPVSDSIKQNLYNIYNHFKGSYCYVDFWGSWCGVCMMEMKNYRPIIQYFKGRGLRFIFLSLNTSKHDIDSIQKANGIEAEFISLSADEAALMGEALGFDGYPTHIMIDPTGKVLKRTIGPLVPYESSFQPAIAWIEKYLNSALTSRH